MQNMIRVEDSQGVIHVYFDMKDGMVTNVSAKDNGLPTTFDIEALKDWCAKEYIQSTLQLALYYKDGTVPLKC